MTTDTHSVKSWTYLYTKKQPDGTYHWHGFLEDGVFVER